MDKSTPQTVDGLTLDNMRNPEIKKASVLSSLMQDSGIPGRHKIDRYNKFERFDTLDPYNTVTTTKEYLFFTKPDLNIFKDGDGYTLNTELNPVPIFNEANQPQRYREVLKQLQSSVHGASPFMNILSNTVTSSLDLPGIDADEIATAANMNGTKISYRLTSTNSDNDFSFNLEFEDTKYLEVYMLFKLYDEYERLKHQGRVSPDKKYIMNRILHDQISIYKFIVDADNESLLYWAKLYGCFPRSVPRDTFSNMDQSGGLKFSIDWKCQFVEDMDPLILSDFNYTVDQYVGGKRVYPLYDANNYKVNTEWPTLPYIERAPNENFGRGIISRPRLKWLR